MSTLVFSNIDIGCPALRISTSTMCVTFLYSTIHDYTVLFTIHWNWLFSIEDLYLNYVCHAILFFCTAFCLISLPGAPSSTTIIVFFAKNQKNEQAWVIIREAIALTKFTFSTFIINWYFSVSFGLEYAGHEDLLHVEVNNIITSWSPELPKYSTTSNVKSHSLLLRFIKLVQIKFVTFVTEETGQKILLPKVKGVSKYEF